MQAKPNQRKYYCPYCEKGMENNRENHFNQEVWRIYCTNDNCGFSGIGWEIHKLESFEINKIQRMDEILDPED